MTKHGKAVAKLVPIIDETTSIRGSVSLLAEDDEAYFSTEETCMPSGDRVLLDTHALLWWQAQPGQERPERISVYAWERITAASCVLVSPLSCWEVAMFVGKDRIRLDRPTAAWIHDVFASEGIGVAELTPQIAVAAAELADFHGYPADRFLYATARCLGVSLLSKDRLLHDYAEVDRTVTVVW